MEDSPRTYRPTATSDDYDLTISAKDYLSAHPKKKHSMMLNFGNKTSNVFGADQTPTPTRFIRNCEEVGLFQDLQNVNVNPFEETFRKAVESGKTGKAALQNSRFSYVSDDTLHTPHVFPHIVENDSTAQRVQQDKLGVERANYGGSEKGGVLRAGLKVVRQEADTSQLRPIAPAIQPQMGKSPPPHPPVQLILQMPDGRLMQLNATPLDMDKKTELQGPIDLVARVDKGKTDTAEVIVRPAPAIKVDCDNISPFIKERLKARLGNPSSFRLVQRPISTEQWVGRGELSRGPRLTVPCNVNHFEDDEETKRRKFLERNRAAAMRCREKRKFWMAALEQRAEEMMCNNQQLQAEVGALRSEVAHLKTLLLAHRDCPVTRAMCTNNQTVPSQEITGIRGIPVVLKTLVSPFRTPKPLYTENTVQQNLKRKLKTVPCKKTVQITQLEIKKVNRLDLPKKKRLMLDIEMAKQSQVSHCLSSKEQSPIIRSDEYLSSTLVSNEPSELEIGKSVATQVIKVNPNALFRDTSLLNISPPAGIDYS